MPSILFPLRDVRLIVPRSALDELIELEKALHKLEVRRDRKRMEQLLHPDFFEVGRSGQRYSRNEILAEFLDGDSLPKIAAYGFKGCELGQNIWLITYTSAHEAESGDLSRKTARTSVWTGTRGSYLLRFHQGTPLSGG